MQPAAMWRLSQRSPISQPSSTPPICDSVIRVMTSEACGERVAEALLHVRDGVHVDRGAPPAARSRGRARAARTRACAAPRAAVKSRRPRRLGAAGVGSGGGAGGRPSTVSPISGGLRRITSASGRPTHDRDHAGGESGGAPAVGLQRPAPPAARDAAEREAELHRATARGRGALEPVDERDVEREEAAQAGAERDDDERAVEARRACRSGSAA